MKIILLLIIINNNNNNNRTERRNSRVLTISSLHRELSPARTLKWPGRNHVQINRVQIMCNTSSAFHMQFVVGWLLNVPATCKCISGTDLHRQFYVLPH